MRNGEYLECQRDILDRSETGTLNINEYVPEPDDEQELLASAVSYIVHTLGLRLDQTVFPEE